MASLKQFMSDPEVKKLAEQATWLSKAMFKTHDSVDWEKLNDRFGQLLMQLSKKTGMKVGDIHRQLYEATASTVQAGKLSLQQLKGMPKGTRLSIDGVPNTMGEWGAERSAPGKWRVWNNQEKVNEVMTDEKLADMIKSAKSATKASFKNAVPGNLADNTKPSTPATQKHAVDMLKQGGILPPEEKADSYPVLTASVKREIIATLLKSKQPKLATWASRNLRTVQAAKNYASVVFMQNSQDFNDFKGSGGKGQEGFFDSSEKEMMRYLMQWDYGDNYGEIVDPMQMKGSGDDVYKFGKYLMTYNPKLGYAGLYVKA